MVEGVIAVKRIIGALETCRSLTMLEADPRVCLSGRACCLRDGGLDCDPSSDPSSDFDESYSHSRDVYLPQNVLSCAGVYAGLDSEATSESRRPTRQTARWVFCFGFDLDLNLNLDLNFCNSFLKTREFNASRAIAGCGMTRTRS